MTGERLKGKIIQTLELTVPHAEYNSCLLDGRFHLDTICEARGHWLLTENMISLLSKGNADIDMHIVENCNENGVCETLSDGCNSLCGCGMKILPGVKDQCAVDVVLFREVQSRLLTRLSYGYNLERIRSLEGILRVGLQKSLKSGFEDEGRNERTFPRDPQPITTIVIGSLPRAVTTGESFILKDLRQIPFIVKK